MKNPHKKYSCLLFLLLLTGCEKFIIDYGNEGVHPGNGAHLLVTGTVFIGSDDGNLYAFSATDGTKKWSAKTGAAISTSPFADVSFFHNGTISSSTVVTGSEDGTIYAYDSFTGKLLWSFKTGGPIQVDPFISDGVVLVNSEDGNLYGLKETSGEKLWSYPTHGGVGPNLVVANHVVYCSSKDGNVYAVHVDDGSLLWANIPGTGASSSPTNAPGFVFVGSKDSTLVTLDLNYGVVRYVTQHFTHLIVNSPLQMDNEVVLAIEDNGNLLEIEGYTSNWWKEVNVGKSSPTMVNRYLFYGDQGGLLRRDDNRINDGAGGSGFLTTGPINSSPTVAHEWVFVGSDDFKLYAFDFINTVNSLKWTAATGGKIRSSPCVMDTLGVVYHPYFSGYQ